MLLNSLFSNNNWLRLTTNSNPSVTRLTCSDSSTVFYKNTRWTSQERKISATTMRPIRWLQLLTSSSPACSRSKRLSSINIRSLSTKWFLN
jgi:hypothetical protein